MEKYHSQEEIYEHCYALFAALVKIYDGYITPLGATSVRAWKSKCAADGTMYNDSFISGLRRINIDGTILSITYQLPMKWWDKIHCVELSRGFTEDGSTTQEIVAKLGRL